MAETTWKKSACILCECNCGLEVAVDGRTLVKFRGDKQHPASAGYACEKPQRLNHYQNGRHRLHAPLRRRSDGTYEEIDWDTAVREIAARLAAVRDTHGGDKIFYYGGGGQGNHLGGAYSRALLTALGAKYRSNALAQEKTGEMWVDGRLYGGHTKGDFEHSEVVVFLGKNPWQSHSFPRARVVLKEIAADPKRTMIVIDPRRSETAQLADIHLQVRPGTDAWCMTAILGVLVQERLIHRPFLERHTTGFEQVLAALAEIPVAEYAQRCGVAEDLLRSAARRIGTATGGVTTYEDLGIQQAPHSTLVSYLNKLVWILTGNFARPGGMYLHSSMISLVGPDALAGGAGPGTDKVEASLAESLARWARRAGSSGARFLSKAVPALASMPATHALTAQSAKRLLTRLAPGARALFASAPAAKTGSNGGGRRTPVTGARIIGGLVPCNAIAEEILTDHPARLRAMWIESANPAHSLADSERFRQALSALDLVVVVDVAFTETARHAHYVLPASSQFEKWEATFFNFEFPHNVFHLRAPLIDALPGTLAEPEIYARIIRALGVVDAALLERLHKAALAGREIFTLSFFAAVAADRKLLGLAPYVLYETLGKVLPEGAASAAVLWAAAHLCALSNPGAVRRAGFDGPGLSAGEKLFEAVLHGRSGVIFSVDEWKDVWSYVRRPDRRIAMAIPELLERLRQLGQERSDWTSEAYPFVLSAGERRSFTANTIIRDPAWRKKDAQGALRMSPSDAERLGLVEGDRVRVVTERGAAEALVEVSAMMQPGHVSLPNGLGLDYPDANGGAAQRTGVAPNELTSLHHRDWLAGTPWHKHVPARIEPLARAAQAAG